MNNTKRFLPFALPEIGEEEIAEVVDTLKSGWISTGPKTTLFEQEFAAYMGGGVNAIAVNSATAGLHLALEAIGIQAGDEVIVPSYTFTATAEIVRYFDAHPVFVDSDPNTFNIDVSKIEDRITSRTRAIIPVHFGGLACDMEAILRLARLHDLRVVEDAAHALPTTFRGKLVGALESDAAVFSFYATKAITTGEGGMLVTRSDSIAQRAKTMRLHGIDRDAFSRYSSTTPAWYYEIVAPGFKYNMSDIAAAIGIHQLRKLASFRLRREAIAETYNDALKQLPLHLPPRAPEGEVHAWHLYPVRLTEACPVGRDELIEKMATLGVGCSVHFIPLHVHPYWRERYNLRSADFPIAQRLYEREVSLPIFSLMSDSDVDFVVESLHRILTVA